MSSRNIFWAENCKWPLCESHSACWFDSAFRFRVSGIPAKVKEQDGPLCCSDKSREQPKVSHRHVASTWEYGNPNWILLSWLKSFNNCGTLLKQTKRKNWPSEWAEGEAGAAATPELHLSTSPPRQGESNAACNDAARTTQARFRRHTFRQAAACRQHILCQCSALF